MAARRTTTEQGYGWQWQKLRLEAFRVYGHVCWMCGRYADTVDHLDPLAQVGRHTLPSIDRVRPACRSCNSSRGATQGNRARGQARKAQRGAREPLRRSERW